MTYRQRTVVLPFVIRALELGFKPYASNDKAVKHFYWFRDSETGIGVSWFNPDRPSYTVHYTSTSWGPRAIELLEQLAQPDPRLR